MNGKISEAVFAQYKAGDEFRDIAKANGIHISELRDLIAVETAHDVLRNPIKEDLMYARRYEARVKRGLVRDDA